VGTALDPTGHKGLAGEPTACLAAKPLKLLSELLCLAVISAPAAFCKDLSGEAPPGLYKTMPSFCRICSTGRRTLSAWFSLSSKEKLLPLSGLAGVDAIDSLGVVGWGSTGKGDMGLGGVQPNTMSDRCWGGVGVGSRGERGFHWLGVSVGLLMPIMGAQGGDSTGLLKLLCRL